MLDNKKTEHCSAFKEYYPAKKYNFFHIKAKGQGGGNHDQRQTDVVFFQKNLDN